MTSGAIVCQTSANESCLCMHLVFMGNKTCLRCLQWLRATSVIRGDPLFIHHFSSDTSHSSLLFFHALQTKQKPPLQPQLMDPPPTYIPKPRLSFHHLVKVPPRAVHPDPPAVLAGSTVERGAVLGVIGKTFGLILP